MGKNDIPCGRTAAAKAKNALHVFVHFVQILVIFLSKLQELHKKIKKTFDFFVSLC